MNTIKDQDHSKNQQLLKSIVEHAIDQANFTIKNLAKRPTVSMLIECENCLTDLMPVVQLIAVDHIEYAPIYDRLSETLDAVQRGCDFDLIDLNYKKEKAMNHVMLDLETMGQGNNAAIVAVGAVFFEPTTGEIGDTFYRKIDLESAAQYGEIDPSTVLWWLKQSDEARAEITSNDTVELKHAIVDFSVWLHAKCERINNRVVWGNGSSFDNVILSNAFKAVGYEKPWAFWNDRDVRTVVELGRTLKGFDPKRDMPFTGTAHNALDDAIHQAKYVSAIYKALA